MRLSDEDLRNATLYGVCLVCGTPRKVERRDTSDGSMWTLVAPCGHGDEEQDAVLNASTAAR